MDSMVSNSGSDEDGGIMKINERLMNIFLADADEASRVDCVMNSAPFKFFIILEKETHTRMLTKLIWEVSGLVHARRVSVFNFNSVMDSKLFMGLPYSVTTEMHQFDMLNRVKRISIERSITLENDSVPDVIFLDPSNISRNFMESLPACCKVAVLTRIQLKALELMYEDPNAVGDAVATSVGHIDGKSSECPLVEGAKRVIGELSLEISKWFSEQKREQNQ